MPLSFAYKTLAYMHHARTFTYSTTLHIVNAPLLLFDQPHHDLQTPGMHIVRRLLTKLELKQRTALVHEHTLQCTGRRYHQAVRIHNAHRLNQQSNIAEYNTNCNIIIWNAPLLRIQNACMHASCTYIHLLISTCTLLTTWF